MNIIYGNLIAEIVPIRLMSIVLEPLTNKEFIM